jgi:hypothetical protein
VLDVLVHQANPMFKEIGDICAARTERSLADRGATPSSGRTAPAMRVR